MRTPRQKFFESAFRKPFEEIAQRVEFEEALYSALLELQMELPEPTDPANGWDQASRLAGARRFVQIFSSLHLKEEDKPRLKMPTLKPPQ